MKILGTKNLGKILVYLGLKISRRKVYMTISRGQQELVLDHMVKELTLEELQNIARESIKRVWTEAPQRKEEDWKRFLDDTTQPLNIVGGYK